MENLIIQGKLCDGIDTIYKQVNEDTLWELYLSISIKEQSYNEWKNEMISKNQKQKEPIFEVAENIEEVKNKARNILNNFKPQ